MDDEDAGREVASVVLDGFLFQELVGFFDGFRSVGLGIIEDEEEAQQLVYKDVLLRCVFVSDFQGAVKLFSRQFQITPIEGLYGFDHQRPQGVCLAVPGGDGAFQEKQIGFQEIRKITCRLVMDDAVILDNVSDGFRFLMVRIVVSDQLVELVGKKRIQFTWIQGMEHGQEVFLVKLGVKILKIIIGPKRVPLNFEKLVGVVGIDGANNFPKKLVFILHL